MSDAFGKEYHRKWRDENRGRVRAAHARYNAKNPQTDRHRLRRYGLTTDQFQAIMEAQDHKCPVCDRDLDGTVYHIDHCHKTDAVRGVLCMNCNTAIGHLGDDIAGLMRAVRYLQNPTGVPECDESQLSFLR